MTLNLDDYRSPLPALEFIERAFSDFDAMPAEKVREPNREQKDFVEEIVPLAYFAKFLLQPEQKITCQFVGGNANYDGFFTFDGPEVERGILPAEVHIEVTLACSEKDYLYGKSLNRHGSAAIDPDIYEDKKTGDIVSKATVRDGGTAKAETSDWVERRIRKKTGKKYPKITWLLVAAKPHRAMRLSEWADICTTHAEFVRTQDTFGQVFVVDHGNTYFVGHSVRTYTDESGFIVSTTSYK